MRHLHSADYYPQRIGMREYSELDPVERAQLLTFLTDILLDQPHVLDEVERRTAAGRLHAGKGGEGGAWPSKVYSTEELAARREADARGELITDFSGCVLCLQDAGLVRCEACDARYHMACLGYSSNPSGTWVCPECHVGGRGECAGVVTAAVGLVRVHVAGL
jgi:PHD-finger/WSTF, HB1, Itc1p, MBD9 motif 1